ncbi:MAG: heparinase II/III-family protein [Candidatus Pacebacteria bacterium]|nr:heparinase II/III-family protein [Candidatus Paceibacterota bacterium]
MFVRLTLTTVFVGLVFSALGAEAPRLPFAPPPPVGEHPRIYLTPGDLPALRARFTPPWLEQLPACQRVVSRARSAADPDSGFGKALSKYAAGEAGMDANISESLVCLALGYLALDEAEFAEAALPAALRALGNGHGNMWLRATLYDWLFNAMDNEQREVARSALGSACAKGFAAHSKPYRDHGMDPNVTTYRVHNWIPHIIGGEFLMGVMAIEGEEGYEEKWLEAGAAAMVDFLHVGTGADGAGWEGVSYYGFGLNQGTFAVDGLARRGYPAMPERLRHIGTWLLYERLPWPGEWNMTHDSWMTPFNSIWKRVAAQWPDEKSARLAAQLLPTGQNNNLIADALWGFPPDSELTLETLDLSLAKYFPFRQQVEMRGDWSEDAIKVHFESKFHGVPGRPGHQHADRNHFTLHAHGQSWAIDSGVHWPWTEGHNAILIDGIGQGQFCPSGRICAYHHGEFATVARGDAKKAYDYEIYFPPFRVDNEWHGDMPDGGEAWEYLFFNAARRSHNPVKRAYRSLFFMRGDHSYLMVVDDIQKDDERHLYEWLLQTPLSNVLDMSRENGLTIRPRWSGEYLETDRASGACAPLALTFTAPETGEYDLYYLRSGHRSNSWNYRWTVTFNDESTPQFVGSSEWRWARIGRMQPGENKVRIQLLVGDRLRVARFARIPAGALPPDRLTDMDDFQGEFLSVGEETPDNWKRVPADPNPARCDVIALTPDDVKVTPDYYARVADDGKKKGAQYRIRLGATAVAPRFRTVLIPWREGVHGEPTVTADDHNATLEWPDGTVDRWTFASSGAIYSDRRDAAAVERHQADSVRWLAAHLTRWEVKGQLRLYMARPSAVVSLHEDTLSISGSGWLKLRACDVDVTRVVANGRELPFDRFGADVLVDEVY